MKKIMMTLAAVAVAATMNAQMYIGGNLGFSTSKDKTDPADEQTVTGFTIQPEIGYQLDDKFGVGIVLGYQYNKTKHEGTISNIPYSSDVKASAFLIKPYLRYQCFTAGKFNVFVDGGLNFKTISRDNMKNELDFGLFVSPGIAYNVNEKWSIVAHLNDMFTLGYHKSAVADIAGAPDAPTSFQADLASGGFNVGALTFGIYYNF